jgi:hypothetical protein
MICPLQKSNNISPSSVSPNETPRTITKRTDDETYRPYRFHAIKYTKHAQKVCPTCGELFTPIRSNQIYHNAYCRLRAWRKAQREGA